MPSKIQECRMLLQVNIALRAAILIISNIIHYIVDENELLGGPTKVQAHSEQEALISYILSKQSSITDTGGIMLMLFLHSIQGRMGGRGK